MPARRSPSRPPARRLACLLLALAAGSLSLLAPGPATAADGAVLVARPARPASVTAGSLAEGSVRVTFTMPRLRSRATFAVDLRHQAGGDTDLHV